MKKSRFARLAIALGLITACHGGASTLALARALPSAADAAAAPTVDSARLLDDVRTLASPAFAGRKTGTDGNRKAQAFLQARFEALGLRPFGASHAHPFAAPTAAGGVNYVGYIRGSQTPDRFMLISAHYDHLGVVDGQLHPGADDNASGVGAMLAMAAWFKAHPPRHSVVFAAFDAEEIGLRGAKAFLAALPFPKDRLALTVNLDMVSRNANNEIFVAGTSYTPAFKPLVEQVARRAAVKLRMGHDMPNALAGHGDDWTGSSDHAPFHEAGIPFLYFGVEDHADYHAPGDTFEHIDQAFYVKVATLLVDMADTLDRNLDGIK